MSVRDKYQPVLDLGMQLNVKDGQVEEEMGRLKIGGTVATPYEKDLLWDKIKEIGGDNPMDIMADIQVADASHYHVHTVGRGDTLGHIAQKYLGKASRYMEIAKANDLANPDLIRVGQDLVIPAK